MKPPIVVSLTPAIDKRANPIFLLTLSGENWQLNVWVTEQDLALVRSVRTARWNDRGSVEIGKSANASTYWSCEDGNLSILVGHDDECWDIGFMMPEKVLDELISEIERERNANREG